MKFLMAMAIPLVFLSGCAVAGADSAPQDLPVMADSRLSESLSPEIAHQMEEHDLQGLSIAVFDDYRVVYSNQWGAKASSSADRIDSQTAFSTASISKPVVALLCVILEEQGLIDLDEPIANYLTSWELPASEYTENVQVSWAHLLSHTAGTSQHGFADYYAGDDIPTLVQSLNGELPRYDEPISFLFEPGSDWQYSGGGYVIVQLALEDHFGRPLRELAQEYVFDRLNMRHSTMAQPGEVGFPENVASVHDAEGAVIRSGLSITPQVAASGMWSTPEDLAILALAMQNALRNEAGSVISHATAERLTHIISLESSGGHTLSWFRGFGFGNTDWMRFDGSNTGVGGEFLASMEDGFGMVMLANGDRPNRFPIFAFLRSAIIESMGWERPIEEAERRPVPDRLARSIEGRYRDFLYGENLESEIIRSGGRMYLVSPVFGHFLGKDRSEMVYLGDNTFKIIDYPNDVRFNLDADHALGGITLLRGNDMRLSLDIPVRDILPQ